MKKREPKEKRNKYSFYVTYKFYIDPSCTNIFARNGNGSSVIYSKHKRFSVSDLEEIQGILKKECADSNIKVENIIILDWKMLRS